MLLKNYFKKKSKFSIAIDVAIGIMLIFLLIPATRKQTAALILKPTLFLHQPRVIKDKLPLSQMAKHWQLKSTSGATVSLHEFEGKVIFINLWATWCPPCIAEMPQLQKLYNDYGDKIEFLFVSNENPGTMQNFLDSKNYTLPAYYPISDYPDDFDTSSIPATFIVNAKGEIVISKKGVAQWNSSRMRKILDALIAN
jgi:thiol-disulfide isomerase/thioredoxin